MSLKYACFLSYRGISSDYYKAIVEQMYDSLNDELKILMELDEPVYYDWSRFSPHAPDYSASQQALCDSLCMIVLFVPRYFKSFPCAIEYKTMERLEAQRLSRLPTSQYQQRLIIPIVLRGANMLPDHLRLNPQCLYMDDLSTFDIDRTKIIQVAQYIAERYALFERLAVDIDTNQDVFQFPSENDVKDLMDTADRSRNLFPGYKY